MRYFANLTAGRIVLWCYLIWYPFFATRYFDPSPALWLTSLGCCSMFCGFSQKGGGRGATTRSRFAQYFDWLSGDDLGADAGVGEDFE